MYICPCTHVDHSSEVSDGDKSDAINNDDIINEDTSKADEDHESPDTVTIGTLTTSTSITKGKKDHDTLEDVNEQVRKIIRIHIHVVQLLMAELMTGRLVAQFLIIGKPVC